MLIRPRRNLYTYISCATGIHANFARIQLAAISESLYDSITFSKRFTIIFSLSVKNTVIGSITLE